MALDVPVDNVEADTVQIDAVNDVKVTARPDDALALIPSVPPAEKARFAIAPKVIVWLASVSITILLFALSDPAAPGVGSVSTALALALPSMVPPFSIRADTDAHSNHAALCPAATVYVKVNVLVPLPDE